MKKTTILTILLVFCLCLCACTGGSGGYSQTATNTCKSCGRTYEAGDSGGNYMNIARTGMCKNCYNNFKWGQDAIGK
jgi:hypothetical protein